MEYSEKILNFIENNEVTAYALAKTTGIKEATFSKWRKQPTSNISIILIEKIAAYFDITITELLGLNGAPAFSTHETNLIHTFRALDPPGKYLVNTVAEVELQRVKEQQKTAEVQSRPINIYRLPVSAGSGIELLDEEEPETIFIPLTPESQRADFVLSVSGNSMEPDFSGGDLILIRQAQTVEPGQLGVFGVDSKAYFKRLGVNELHSINTDYPPIKLDENNNITCFGRVLGKTQKINKG